MVGILLSYWGGLFSGATLVSGSVQFLGGKSVKVPHLIIKFHRVAYKKITPAADFIDFCCHIKTGVICRVKTGGEIPSLKLT